MKTIFWIIIAFVLIAIIFGPSYLRDLHSRETPGQVLNPSIGVTPSKDTSPWKE